MRFVASSSSCGGWFFARVEHRQRLPLGFLGLVVGADGDRRRVRSSIALRLAWRGRFGLLLARFVALSAAD